MWKGFSLLPLCNQHVLLPRPVLELLHGRYDRCEVWIKQCRRFDDIRFHSRWLAHSKGLESKSTLENNLCSLFRFYLLPGALPTARARSCAELTKFSASITVSPPCQEGVFGAGQRLPDVIREDRRVSRGNAETLTNPRWDHTHPGRGTWTSGITSAARSDMWGKPTAALCEVTTF